MKLAGDESGIQELKAMHAANEGFMKALLEDVRTTTNHVTTFRGPTGNRWRLRLDPLSGELYVEVAPPYSTRPPPPPDPTSD